MTFLTRFEYTKFLGADGMGRNFIAVDERTPTLKRCVIKQFFPGPQVLSNLTMHKKANDACKYKKQKISSVKYYLDIMGRFIIVFIVLVQEGS